MIQVIIPTYNRELCIRYLIEQSIEPYKGILFRFLILDSSTSDDTEMLCKQLNHCKQFEYQRVASDVQPDDKVVNAIMHCSDDYYWLLGDGNLVDFNGIEQTLLSANYKEYDVLEIDSLESKRNPIRRSEHFIERSNLVSYIATNFTYLTYWGSSIIHTTRAKECFLNGCMDKYRQDILSWWSACLICEMINTDDANVVRTKAGTLYTKAFKGNPGKKDRSWANGEKYFLTTFEVFNRDIKLLPEMFSSVKKDIIKNFRDDLLVSKRYLLQLKLGGVLSTQYVKKYKREIQIVKGYYLYMLLLSLTPNALLVGLQKVYRIGKKVIK